MAQVKRPLLLLFYGEGTKKIHGKVAEKVSSIHQGALNLQWSCKQRNPNVFTAAQLERADYVAVIGAGERMKKIVAAHKKAKINAVLVSPNKVVSASKDSVVSGDWLQDLFGLKKDGDGDDDPGSGGSGEGTDKAPKE